MFAAHYYLNTLLGQIQGHIQHHGSLLRCCSEMRQQARRMELCMGMQAALNFSEFSVALIWLSYVKLGRHLCFNCRQTTIILVMLPKSERCLHYIAGDPGHSSAHRSAIDRFTTDTCSLPKALPRLLWPCNLRSQQHLSWTSNANSRLVWMWGLLHARDWSSCSCG
jgi:hypothetical protein